MTFELIMLKPPTNCSGLHGYNHDNRVRHRCSIPLKHVGKRRYGPACCYIMSGYPYSPRANAQTYWSLIAMLFHREPMGAGKRPEFDEDHAAPLIQILTWLGLAFSSLSIIAHFSTKKAMSIPTTKGDLMLLVALVSKESSHCVHMADWKSFSSWVQGRQSRSLVLLVRKSGIPRPRCRIQRSHKLGRYFESSHLGICMAKSHRHCTAAKSSLCLHL